MTGNLIAWGSVALAAFTLWCCTAHSSLVQVSASGGNVARVGRLDIEGGGMVDVQGTLAVVGHMGPPYATSIIDVSNPEKPRILSRIKTRPGTHSHKARLCGSTLIVNVEAYGGLRKEDKAGLLFFDIQDPMAPKEVGFLEMGRAGAHRFQADCARNLVYASGSADGYQGNISLIVDFSNPALPRELGRWWYPGQWTAGGEKPSRPAGSVRTHHPLRLGDRLYVSLWDGGFAIVDITDIRKPKTVSTYNYHPVYAPPTHTALPVGHTIMGRRWLVVFDEALGASCDDPPAFMWVVDVSDEGMPIPVSTFQVPAAEYCKGTRGRFGAHQPHEHVGKDNLVYAAWFSGGLRVIDISNPYRPDEVGYYIPPVREGCGSVESNDVFVDTKGLIYLIDRCRGLDILRFTRSGKKTR